MISETTLASKVVQWPHGDPNHVIRTILAQANFRSTAIAQAPPKSIWQIIYEAIIALLKRVLGRIFSGVHVPTGSGTVLSVVVVALVAFATILLGVRILGALLRREHKTNRQIMGSPLSRDRTAAAWREIAERAAAEGAFARAIVALFSSAICLLDERKIIPTDDARTPGEYRRLVRRKHPAVATAFDTVSECFIHAAYAPEPARQHDYDAAARAYAVLEPSIRQA
ncbi:MAG TPA: DUF4129 domain-containing protein [Candidatus Baltobacteraceae bacterium]|nr:DUF4129 domain-containing protein [Candidatus Baltobacteraceae bacterium]